VIQGIALIFSSLGKLPIVTGWQPVLPRLARPSSFLNPFRLCVGARHSASTKKGYLKSEKKFFLNGSDLLP